MSMQNTQLIILTLAIIPYKSCAKHQAYVVHEESVALTEHRHDYGGCSSAKADIAHLFLYAHHKTLHLPV